GRSEVARRLDLGDRHESEARVLELALQERRDLFFHELIHPVQSLALHQRISTELSSTWPSTWSSMKSIALATTSLACRASAETYATASVARCQRSWWSTSATDTSNRARTFSLRPFRACRFSLRDATSGRCSSTRPSATRAADTAPSGAISSIIGTPRSAGRRAPRRPAACNA